MDEELANWRPVYRGRLLLGLAAIVVGVVIGAFAIKPETATDWAKFAGWCVVVGGVGAFYLSSAGRFFCPGCKKHISARMPWICGYCDSANEGLLWNTFLGKCRECGASPGGLVCPHPHRSGVGSPEPFLILLAGAPDSTHPARKLTPRLPGENFEQMQARWIREREILEAELLDQGASSKTALANATVKYTAAERKLTTARSAQLQGGAPTKETETESVERELRGRIERLKAANAGIPQFTKTYEEGCALIDSLAFLSPEKKANLKGDLQVRIEDEIRLLVEFRPGSR